MLMLRMLPLGLFGVFGGEIASRFNRRIVLLAMFAGSAVVSATVANLAYLGQLAVWHLGIAAFAAGFAFGLPHVPAHSQVTAGRVFERIAGGLRDLKRLPVLQGVLAVTVVFNIWGFPVMSMVPVIGAGKLGLPPFEIGVLASMEGLGSLLGALALAALARRRQYRFLYFFGVLTFLVCATVFAHSALPLLTGALLIVLGVSMAAFAAMQSVLVLQYALVDGRQRMMGLLSACIGSGPIGLLHLGLMAAWFGASAACTIIAVEGLVALGRVALKWRGLIGGQRPP